MLIARYLLFWGLRGDFILDTKTCCLIVWLKEARQPRLKMIIILAQGGIVASFLIL
jgi:hypothetical protein